MFKVYGMEDEKRKPRAIMEFDDHRVAVAFLEKGGAKNLSRGCPVELRKYHRHLQEHNIQPTRVFKVGKLVFALGHERHRRERKERGG